MHLVQGSAHHDARTELGEEVGPSALEVLRRTLKLGEEENLGKLSVQTFNPLGGLLGDSITMQVRDRRQLVVFESDVLEDRRGIVRTPRRLHASSSFAMKASLYPSGLSLMVGALHASVKAETSSLPWTEVVPLLNRPRCDALKEVFTYAIGNTFLLDGASGPLTLRPSQGDALRALMHNLGEKSSEGPPLWARSSTHDIEARLELTCDVTHADFSFDGAHEALGSIQSAVDVIVTPTEDVKGYLARLFRGQASFVRYLAQACKDGCGVFRLDHQRLLACIQAAEGQLYTCVIGGSWNSSVGGRFCDTPALDAPMVQTRPVSRYAVARLNMQAFGLAARTAVRQVLVAPSG